ncbi:hypothetical protein V2J09_020758 [Rumex salicifolius]
MLLRSLLHDLLLPRADIPRDYALVKTIVSDFTFHSPTPRRPLRLNPSHRQQLLLLDWRRGSVFDRISATAVYALIYEMGSRGRPMFDLNEPPMETNEEIDEYTGVDPQNSLPLLSGCRSDLLVTSTPTPSIASNNAFSHNSSVSGFQPFIRTKLSSSLESSDDQKKLGAWNSDGQSIPKFSNNERLLTPDPQPVEREEGEWSDTEFSAEVPGNISSSLRHAMQPAINGKALPEKEMADGKDHSATELPDGRISLTTIVSELARNETPSLSVQPDAETHDVGGSDNGNLEVDSDCNKSAYGQIDFDLVSRKKEVRGVEASYALKCANTVGKKHKLDEQKEAMLGKKRNRQTMFLNLEDVKQVGAVKSSTPRRQTVPTPSSRNMRGSRAVLPAERNGEKQSDIKTQNPVDLSSKEDRNSVESSEYSSECNTDVNAGLLTRPRRLNSINDLSMEGNSGSRQNSRKQAADSFQAKNSQGSFRKPALQNHVSVDLNSGGNKKNLLRKQMGVSSQYQDTSVERLLREVTSAKFWHSQEDTELQCVPGQFESVEEYVSVFEPLLFEECRAQLYSTWEELTEVSARDSHIMVRVKGVERRERGWFDVVVLPLNETKWMFKEGDVAVLSSSKPGPVRTRRNANTSTEEHQEPEVTGRVVGTVRRHIPIDTRDPIGAILHFYVGDSYDSSSSADSDHILRKLQPRGVWFLTVLGSVATSQREYVALHAFRRLNSQMQDAVLQPSHEHFPKYQEQTPVIPECFTPNFIEHLNRSFNGPQLASIQWAATHTAAGTNNGMAKRQDPWPFTLVQGPPGTGKTHTVWGMLNVIHLVQYQHYYTALLKKLTPDSYKQANENNTDNVASGSIDEVLQNMDQNLFRTLPKLCPKPRMLVCAPSNAATDELLARVLDRGFIDGEMKVYRPDVARVGVDTQSRAAQAVSVERRTEQLLVKSREEVIGWLQQLKGRENQLAHQIAALQRQLVAAAAAGRSQGSVGVDPDVLMARDQNRDALLQNLSAVVEGRDKVLVEMSRLLILEGRFRPGSGFNLEEARASLEASFANEAEIVFTTLSSSGRKLFSRLTHGFDMVVIDEAAQASEVAILPPLALGAARCVLVGDPQQLPATVISKAAGTLLYSRSLFERFQQAGCPTMLLSVQYRMHPQIRDFPSRYFYQGRLTDSETVANLPDEKYYKDPLLRPYIFFDITHGRESHRGGSVSFQNVHEAQFCFRLYEHLQKTVKSLSLGKVSVGIITPYKLQLKCLQREFEEVLNSEEGRDLYINTVDAFQGQERDVIIMSCVRASGHGVGFVADIRRMNVALTRARRALWVMGNANALVQSDDWAALIEDSRSRKCYMDMDSLPKEFQVPKVHSYASFPSKFPHGSRGMRSGGPRPRSLDAPAEFKPGTSSEGAPVGRSENNRSVRPHNENSSTNGYDDLGDRSRDSRPSGGIIKGNNLSGPAGKKES